MRQVHVHDDNYTPTQTVRSIATGGTGATSLADAIGDLGGVSKEVLNQPGGLAVAGQNGLVDPANIPDSMVVGTTLALRTALTAGSQAQLEITNYDMAATYRLDIQPNCPIFRSGNSIFFTPPANGVYTIQVNSKKFYYTVGTQKPTKPAIAYPTAAQSGLSDQILMVGTVYADVGGVPFQKARWQISASATFATILKDSGSIYRPAEWLVQGLPANTTLYARLAYTNKAGIDSDWSDTVSFQTAADFIADTNVGAYASTGFNSFGRRFVVAPNESATIVYNALYKHPKNTSLGYDGSLSVYRGNATIKTSEILFQRSNFPVDIDDCSMAISDDGKIFALATRSFERGSDKNQVIVYSVEDGVLHQLQILTNFDEATNAAANHKLSVRLSADGSYLAVGSPGTVVGGLTTGAVVIFFRTQGQYARQAVITRPSAADGDKIGTAVAITGDGSKVLYSRNPATGTNQIIFSSTRTGTAWAAAVNAIVVTAALVDKFGAHIEMNAAGTYAAIASPEATVSAMATRGRVQIFNFNGTAWVDAVTGGAGVSPTNLLAGDKFGSSMRMSRNGAYLAVGAENMTRSGNAKAGGAFLWALSTTIAAAALREFTPPTPAANLKFGSCLAMNETGSGLFIGECVYNDANVTTSGPGKIQRYR